MYRHFYDDCEDGNICDCRESLIGNGMADGRRAFFYVQGADIYYDKSLF